VTPARGPTRSGRARAARSPVRRPSDTEVRVAVPARSLPGPAARFRADVRRAVALTGFPGRLSVAVVDDPSMRVLNREFHACDDATDVLAFALDGSPGVPAGEAFDGEVVVSADTARTEAAARGVTLRSELLLYVVHGVLHLLGEDDHDAGAYRRMHGRALSILAALGETNTIDPARAKLGRRGNRGRPRPRGRAAT
jgi:probable rRNA maturation factor